MHYFSFVKLMFTRFIIHNKQFIINGNVPKCKDCVFLNTGDLVVEGDKYYLSRCNLFGTANLVSGEIAYDFAEFCRKDENQCGKTGKHFSPKNGKNGTNN